MESLSRKRGVFHLESDFQFALAWEIKSLYPDCELRLEVPFNFESKGRIDILVRFGDAIFPIELKYLKKALKYTVDDEPFVLAEGVHDMEMYDCIGDINRMESFCGNLKGFHTGYVVWLTNDSAYWDSSYNASYYNEFHAPNGSIKTGKMYFNPLNPRTNKPPQILKERKYQNPIILNGSYQIKWNDYSDLGVAKGLFKYAVVDVKNSMFGRVSNAKG
jgi:hypothetical protein